LLAGITISASTTFPVEQSLLRTIIFKQVLHPEPPTKYWGRYYLSSHMLPSFLNSLISPSLGQCNQTLSNRSILDKFGGAYW
jgi:hypothetical protein